MSRLLLKGIKAESFAGEQIFLNTTFRGRNATEKFRGRNYATRGSGNCKLGYLWQQMFATTECIYCTRQKYVSTNSGFYLSKIYWCTTRQNLYQHLLVLMYKL